ncbi:hypothetical protein AVEN_263051-1 [Araneus ventricosus]|uniref:Uncharacterized protein n=1 Tax=Araneus ventricosus TaxID=182803 RepID=A0A4Y2ID25_ARAVE|nr:hypothetical protein AVEN_263051-1 [Araneus ventricosus]
MGHANYPDSVPLPMCLHCGERKLCQEAAFPQSVRIGTDFSSHHPSAVLSSQTESARLSDQANRLIMYSVSSLVPWNVFLPPAGGFGKGGGMWSFDEVAISFNYLV